MRNSTLLRRVAFVAVLAALAIPALPADPVGAGIPPILGPAPAPAFADDAPDPDIVFSGGKYYAFTTGTTWGNHIGVLVSDRADAGWNTKNGLPYASSALPDPPGWVAEENAPGVFEWGGRWIMYYAARPSGGGNWCLSVAISTAPTTPFVDNSGGCWYADAAHGGAVDPDPFVDADGRAWLLWKTTDGTSVQPARIWAAPLSADGLSFTEAPRLILHQDDVPYAGFETVENPQMINVGGTYYLFFSQGVWDSGNYRTGYAVCGSPVGPCTSAPGPILDSYASVRGPGGASLTVDSTGQWWMAYHGWTGGCTNYGCGGRRVLFVVPVSFDIRVPCSAPTTPVGYRFVAADGGVFAFGNLPFCGSTGAITLNEPIVGMGSTGSGGGYWLFAGDGGIFAFGDAAFHGSTGDLSLAQPIVAMAATPGGAGYWVVAADGGVFAFGDAAFHGSTGGLPLNQPIVGMAVTPTGGGYWLVARDGGVFAFGDAVFHGSTGAVALNQPIISITPSPTGGGYWFVASDGGVFAFGDARFRGSTGGSALNQPIVGLEATPSGSGYWLVARDGGLFAFGDAPFHGSTGGASLNQPVVGMAAG